MERKTEEETEGKKASRCRLAVSSWSGSSKLGGVWLSVLAANALVGAMGLALMAISWSDFDQKAREASELRLRGYKQAVELRVGRLRVAQEIVAHELEAQWRTGGGLVDMPRINALVAKFDYDRFKSHDSGVFSLRVTDETGRIVSGYGVGATPPVDYSDRDYFKHLRDDSSKSFDMSRLVMGKVSKRGAVVFAMTYKKPGGVFAGVVIAAASQEALTQLGSAYRVAPDDSVGMRDARDFSLLARLPRIDPAVEKDTTGVSRMPSGIRRRLMAGEQSGYEKSSDTFEGLPRSIAFEKVEDAPIYAVVGVGRNSFFAPWRAQAWTAAVFYLAFMAMSVALGRRAILSQRRTASAQADYRELNERLERQVEDRTADLSDALARIRKGRDELAEADRLASLGAMVSTVAHELNTPLGNALLSNSSIVEQARWLKESLATGAAKKSEIERGLGRMVEMSTLQAQAIEVAAQLVSSFKQAAADESSERRRSFDAGEEIAMIMESLGPALKRSEASIEVRLDLMAGLSCESYPVALGQIIANIAQNAQWHAFEGRESGILSIKARAVDRSGVSWIVVECSDDGVGMGEEVSAHAFDAFYTTKAGAGGAGLGLALSRRLAERALGGRLWIEPSAEGTQLVLEFPARRV